ncbi:tripartite tricarboxylate transporter permease [Desulforhopalus singaporensis]|uniref:Putative tricarboxylic transport membrane protein n=1 Tax=Desulforhopalus singaporensis TaxID=91360 RepID=A0A1H0V295_9BACT|nr:tripartite tricarboxylate transporter permease [Desulforhopalus singaporensis]SDP72298.1 putative tricarboxylic transport membrane protein [Desulforhopalus singaporensis]
MNELFIAVNMVLESASLIAITVGVFAGIIIGALPGLGSILGITMALPLTFVLPKEASIALLLALYCGSVYGGSIAAILINTPGTPQSAATLFDGHPMAKKGRADLALGWATTASFAGGVISTIILAAAAPLLASFGLRFGPVEYFALGLFALTCIVSVARENIIKGVLAGLFGLFAAVVGQDPLTGDIRFDFNSFELSAGIGLVPFLVGLFALSEVFWRLSEKHSGQNIVIRAGFKIPSFSELRQRFSVMIKSTLIGTWVGALPGIGATAASMVSYAEAKRSSPNSSRFGTGEPDGIIASESANNAVTGGALVPTLSLGIPGDPITAVMLGALVIQGVTPGPRLFTERPDIVYFIFLTLFAANFAMFIFGALLAPIFSRILRIPEQLLMPCIIVLVALGIYSINVDPFDLLVVFVSGIVGFVLRYNGFPLAPVVIGFVLSPLIEQSLRQGLILTDESFLQFFTHPIALVLFIATALFLVWPAVRKYVKRKRSAKILEIV